MVVIAVERVGFDDEQTQVEVFRLHRALFAHHRAVAVAVRKRRADRLQRVAVVGDPLQVGACLGDGLGERWVAVGAEQTQRLIQIVGQLGGCRHGLNQRSTLPLRQHSPHLGHAGAMQGRQIGVDLFDQMADTRFNVAGHGLLPVQGWVSCDILAL